MKDEPRELEAIPAEVGPGDETAKHHTEPRDRELVVIGQHAAPIFERLARRYRRWVDWIMGRG